MISRHQFNTVVVVSSIAIVWTDFIVIQSQLSGKIGTWIPAEKEEVFVVGTHSNTVSVHCSLSDTGQIQRS